MRLGSCFEQKKTRIHSEVTMKKKTKVLAGALGVAGLATAAGYWMFRATRPGVEKASYEVERADGPFEIRRYPEISVASTARIGGVNDQAFGRLFRYIDRGNQEERKIAMTTPVLIDRGAGGSMSFVMPEDEARKGLPEPRSELVTITTRPAGRVAAFTYSGRSERSNEDEAIAGIRRWIAEQGLQPTGDPVIAYYNAPWTPPFLRRNEVLVQIAD